MGRSPDEVRGIIQSLLKTVVEGYDSQAASWKFVLELQRLQQSETPPDLVQIGLDTIGAVEDLGNDPLVKAGLGLMAVVYGRRCMANVLHPEDVIEYGQKALVWLIGAPSSRLKSFLLTEPIEVFAGFLSEAGRFDEAVLVREETKAAWREIDPVGYARCEFLTRIDQFNDWVMRGRPIAEVMGHLGPAFRLARLHNKEPLLAVLLVRLMAQMQHLVSEALYQAIAELTELKGDEAEIWAADVLLARAVLAQKQRQTLVQAGCLGRLLSLSRLPVAVEMTALLMRGRMFFGNPETCDLSRESYREVMDYSGLGAAVPRALAEREFKVKFPS